MADIPLNLTVTSPYGNPAIPETTLVSEPEDDVLRVMLGEFEYSINKAIFQTPPSTRIDIKGEYADNAAALAAGLVVGDLYRTGDILKVVH